MKKRMYMFSDLAAGIAFIILIICIIVMINFAYAQPPQEQKTKIQPISDQMPSARIVFTTTPNESGNWIQLAPLPRYILTDEERDEVERAVMAEAGGESALGQMAVAQCILNACEKDGIRPGQALLKYRYAKARPEPTEQVREMVSKVFDIGQKAVDDDILYFYNPRKVKSAWHESQRFVAEIGNHRFFAEAEKEN